MINICLIGPGDTKSIGMKKEELNNHINGLAESLSKENIELTFLPDKGVCLELVKRFKEKSENKVYGTVPKQDENIGINHLKTYLKFTDEIIDTHNWYKQDILHCLFGDVILMLGNSLGTIGELSYGFYIYKLFKGNNKKMRKLHQSINAGRKQPLELIIYKPFMESELPSEIINSIKKMGCEIKYINSYDEIL